MTNVSPLAEHLTRAMEAGAEQGTPTRAELAEAGARALEMAGKLEAMLMMMNADDDGEYFRTLRADLQGSYVWACCSLVHDLREAVHVLTNTPHPRTLPGGFPGA